MRNARISELRDGLSEYLARVREGETVIVYDRDTPIARIEPIGSAPDGRGQPAWVREAIRRGVLTPPRVSDGAPLPPPVKTAKPARLLEALLEERRTGR
jgi:antitoxin (DNA-binding transcriptional repressor) of toxin-antitoxin stability system